MGVPLHAKQAQRGGRSVAVHTRDSGARRGWVVSATPWPLYARKGPGAYCTGGWVGLSGGLDGYGKFCPTAVRTPDPPARSESLHQLRCSGPKYNIIIIIIIYT